MQLDRSQAELQRFPWTQQMLQHLVTAAGWSDSIQMLGLWLFCHEGKSLSLIKEQHHSCPDFDAVS